MALDSSQKLALGVVGAALVLGAALLVFKRPEKKPEPKPAPVAPAPAPAEEAPPPPPPGPPQPLQKSQADDVKDILEKATKGRDETGAPR
jgi:hypothetical protein